MVPVLDFILRGFRSPSKVVSYPEQAIVEQVVRDGKLQAFHSRLRIRNMSMECDRSLVPCAIQ